MSEMKVDVRAVRAALKLTQAQFASRFHLNLQTLRQWEQGRRSPDSAVQVLFAVINHSPAVVEEALQKAS